MTPPRKLSEDKKFSEIEITDNDLLIKILGAEDENIKFIRKTYKTKMWIKENVIKFSGPKEGVNKTEKLLVELTKIKKEVIDLKVITDLMHTIEGTPTKIEEFNRNVIRTSKKSITPKSANQQDYITNIQTHDITFGIGPAGSGKTFLAMAVAVSMLLDGKYKKIVLTRPAVEAGEKLGFLPGDLAEKITPYLRPLYDALEDMVDKEKATELIQKGVIEVAPLAFMRGRDIKNSFIILDEAQNTTKEQMKMFLTRLGFGSKAVITGDISQVDLPRGETSGLANAIHILKNIEDIPVNIFTETDVVRHPLVRKIIKAYDEHDD